MALRELVAGRAGRDPVELRAGAVEVAEPDERVGHRQGDRPVLRLQLAGLGEDGEGVLGVVLVQQHVGDGAQRLLAPGGGDDRRHVLAHRQRRVGLQQQAGEPHDGGAVVAAGLADRVALAADGLGDVAHHLVEHPEGVPRVEGAHAGLREVAVAAVVAELDGAAEALHRGAVLAAGGVDLPLQVVQVGEVRVRLEGVGEDVERLVPPLQRVEGGDDVPEQQRGVVRLERVELAEGAA